MADVKKEFKDVDPVDAAVLRVMEAERELRLARAAERVARAGRASRV